MNALRVAPLSATDFLNHGIHLDPMNHFDGLVIAALREEYVARMRYLGASDDRCNDANVELACLGEADVVAFHDTITGQNN